MHIGHVLWTLFGWPAGIVLGNLLASAMWSIPGFGVILWRQEKHHREHMDELRKR